MRSAGRAPFSFRVCQLLFPYIEQIAPHLLREQWVGSFLFRSRALDQVQALLLRLERHFKSGAFFAFPCFFFFFFPLAVYLLEWRQHGRRRANERVYAPPQHPLTFPSWPTVGRHQPD